MLRSCRTSSTSGIRQSTLAANDCEDPGCPGSRQRGRTNCLVTVVVIVVAPVAVDVVCCQLHVLIGRGWQFVCVYTYGVCIYASGCEPYTRFYPTRQNPSFVLRCLLVITARSLMN